MSKKPYRKKRKDDPQQEEIPFPGAEDLFPDPRSMEKMMADITRLLEERDFESIDEANAFLQQLLASGQPLPSAKPRTPLEKAQSIMYQAWDANTPRQRIRLAHRALSISKDCADAYVLLAEEEADTIEEAKELYEAGVQAGERALGEEAFTEHEGHFWGIHETRPYMRAREGLAGCLWAMGQRAEAVDHLREMLRLNPGDNQGMRYILLACLLDEGREKEAEQLLKTYDGEISAMWLYTTALLSFKKGGASRKANKQLGEALERNPHVPHYLLGRRYIPQELPPYMGIGDETEAVHYILEAGHFWLRQEGAIDWLRRQAPKPS